MGRSKLFQDVSRLFLLAPDWTYSNVLTSKYAFEGGPAGSAARAFWVRSAATGFAMTAAMSIAIGGKYDPTDIKNLDRVYISVRTRTRRRCTRTGSLLEHPRMPSRL